MTDPSLILVVSDFLNISMFSFTIGLGILSHVKYKKEIRKPDGNTESISDFRRYRMFSVFAAPLILIIGLSMHQLLS